LIKVWSSRNDQTIQREYLSINKPAKESQMSTLNTKSSIIKSIIVGFLLMICFFLIVACIPETTEPPPATVTISRPTDQVPASQTPTNEPVATDESTPTLIPSFTPEPIEESLPVKPQRIEFETEDGTALVGTYFPPAKRSAPLVIMMHWARGDQTDWFEIAQWLQNRLGEYPEDERTSETSVSSMLPAMPKELSYAVFTFDFRGFGESTISDTSGNPEGWLMDAVAAVNTAKTLSGGSVPEYINIGASIGADGAADACDDRCKGALSISPGNYLGVNYSDAVTHLESLNPDALAWCLASEGDAASFEACQTAEGIKYIGISIQGIHMVWICFNLD